MPNAKRITSSRELSSAERQFVRVIQRIAFGHFESLRIHRGALILDPWPAVVQILKFGAGETRPSNNFAEFELKKQLVELFEYIRGVDDGEVRRLEIRHGLPFSMEIEHCISRGMPDV